jgi:hypothetical protein
MQSALAVIRQDKTMQPYSNAKRKLRLFVLIGKSMGVSQPMRERRSGRVMKGKEKKRSYRSCRSCEEKK